MQGLVTPAASKLAPEMLRNTHNQTEFVDFLLSSAENSKKRTTGSDSPKRCPIKWSSKHAKNLGVSARDPAKAVKWSAGQVDSLQQTEPLYHKWLEKDADAANEWLLGESEQKQKELGKVLIRWAEQNGDQKGAAEWRKIIGGEEVSSD